MRVLRLHGSTIAENRADCQAARWTMERTVKPRHRQQARRVRSRTTNQSPEGARPDFRVVGQRATSRAHSSTERTAKPRHRRSPKGGAERKINPHRQASSRLIGSSQTSGFPSENTRFSHRPRQVPSRVIASRIVQGPIARFDYMICECRDYETDPSAACPNDQLCSTSSAVRAR